MLTNSDRIVVVENRGGGGEDYDILPHKMLVGRVKFYFVGTEDRRRKESKVRAK